jgi:poly(A) polymerase
MSPPPLLTGHDLIDHGLDPGPLFKKLLDAVRQAQRNGSVRTQGEALELVDRLLREWKE